MVTHVPQQHSKEPPAPKTRGHGAREAVTLCYGCSGKFTGKGGRRSQPAPSDGKQERHGQVGVSAAKGQRTAVSVWLKDRAGGHAQPRLRARRPPDRITFVARAADLHKLLHLHLDLLWRRLGGGLFGLLGGSPGPAGGTEMPLWPPTRAAKATGPGAGSCPTLTATLGV